jgi:Na+-transporting methylmalonyl-CoA/oxaloacetate decarboxylase gamma subunit
MNVESYGYTVFTMILGMLVVFFALVALSLMMVALKRVVGPQSRFGRRQQAREEGTAVAQEGKRPPRWLEAAVAAYLAEEAVETERPSAEPWPPEVNHYDPWFSRGGAGGMGTGV